MTARRGRLADRADRGPRHPLGSSRRAARPRPRPARRRAGARARSPWRWASSPTATPTNGAASAWRLVDGLPRRDGSPAPRARRRGCGQQACRCADGGCTAWWPRAPTSAMRTTRPRARRARRRRARRRWASPRRPATCCCRCLRSPLRRRRRGGIRAGARTIDRLTLSIGSAADGLERWRSLQEAIDLARGGPVSRAPHARGSFGRGPFVRRAEERPLNWCRAARPPTAGARRADAGAAGRRPRAPRRPARRAGGDARASRQPDRGGVGLAPVALGVLPADRRDPGAPRRRPRRQGRPRPRCTSPCSCAAAPPAHRPQRPAAWTGAGPPPRDSSGASRPRTHVSVQTEIAVLVTAWKRSVAVARVRETTRVRPL